MKIWTKINTSNHKLVQDPYIQFSNNIWVSKLQKRIHENLSLQKKSKLIKTKYFLSSSPLPILVIGMNKNINICDFGSGSLEIFFQINNNCLTSKKINLDCIEVPKVTHLYKKIKDKLNCQKNIKINFFNKFRKKNYDIIHISDSLQYIKDIDKFFKEITLNKPKYIIFNNLTAGENIEIETFQKFYNHKIYYKFFNLKKFLKLLPEYKLIFKSYFLNKILEKYMEYPQIGFDKKEKLKFPCTLIFQIKN